MRMEPPVLAGVLEDKLLDCFSVFCGNPCERVIFFSPFFRENDAVNPDFKVKSVVEPSAVAYCNRDIIGDSHKTYALIGTGFTAKEIDEYPFSARILIYDKA